MQSQYIRWGIVALVILMVGSWIVSSYNAMITAGRDIEGAWGQVQVVLQRRADLIAQEVPIVAAAGKLEKSTLENVTAARSGMLKSFESGSREEQVAAAQKFDQVMYQFRLQVEAYPQIQSLRGFSDLQTQVEGTENRIAVERKRYNDAILSYNKLISVFPKNMIARMFGFADEKQYTATSEQVEKAPEIKFDIQ